MRTRAGAGAAACMHMDAWLRVAWTSGEGCPCCRCTCGNAEVQGRAAGSRRMHDRPVYQAHGSRCLPASEAAATMGG